MARNNGNGNGTAALACKVRLGLVLRNNMSELAGFFNKDDASLAKIVEDRDLLDELRKLGHEGVNENIARGALRFALSGSGYKLENTGPYSGLMTLERYNDAVSRHFANRNMSEVGRSSYRNGTGLFSRTREEVRIDAIEAGRARGRQRGLAEWDEAVLIFGYLISGDKEFQHPKGSGFRGKNSAAITGAVNNAWYEEGSRTSVATMKAISRFSKRGLVWPRKNQD